MATDYLTYVRVASQSAPNMQRLNNLDDFLGGVSLLGIRLRIGVGRALGRLLRPGALAITAAAAIYGICVLAKNEEWPSKSGWTGGHPLGWILLISGAIAVLGTVLSQLGYVRVLRKNDQDKDLQEAVRGVWHVVVDELALDMNKVGAHVWAVKGFTGFRYLEKRATFIMESRRPTDLVWRKGKGAIGIAWDEDEPIIANVEHLDTRAPNEEAFMAIAPRDRYGLSWREFRRARHYRAVLAIPLRRGGKVKGCLSVDLRVDGQAESLDTLTKDDQFDNVLAVCEAVLAKR